MLDERRELEIREMLEKGGISESDELALREELESSSPAPSPKSLSAGQYLLDTVSNIPSSALGVAKGIVETVTSPIETFRGLRSAYRGAIGNVLPDGFVTPYEGQERDKATADAVGNFYSNRYGGLRNIADTIRQDPVGAAADLATGAFVASGALRASGATNSANKAAQVSQAVDPIYQTAKAAKTVIKPVYKSAVGKTTGLGPAVIAEQLKGSTEFKDAIRGVTSESQVVDKADDALSRIKQSRGDAYRSQLENLKNVNKEIPIDDVKNLADDWLNRYNVTKESDGSLDFSRSTVSGASATEVEQVYNIVKDWGSRAKDTTPAMLDILKRRLDDFYSTSRNSRAMVAGLKKAVQSKIESQVPQYAQMTADYAKASELIKELEKALGVGDRTSADTAIRRLTTALREDKSLRRDLLKVLDETGEGNVTASVAGTLSRPVANRSLESLATIGTGVGAATLFSNPYLAALVPLASPRVVGELNIVLGKVGRAAPKARGAGLAAYQASNPPTE